MGGITTHKQSIDVGCDFLEKGTTYTATIFRDKMDGLKLTVETKEMASSDTIPLATADRGGFVVHFAPKR